MTAANPPESLDRFVGRERETGELLRLVRGRRLVTLVGPGGAGKSRLARELVPRSHADRAVRVELGAFTSAESLDHAVAEAVRIADEPDQPAGSLAEAIDGRPLLLVLDNCEGVAEACAALVQNLLSRCSGLRVLATSRQPLGVIGEAVYAVGELPLPPPGTEPAMTALSRSDAVRLFLERARTVLPDFALTPENACTVAAICRRLDGMPLAIELAARQVRPFGVAGVLERLSDPFPLLTNPDPTASGRHRSLLAAIDWSYQLLDHQEQTVLRRLSVFAGGFDADAANAVCGKEISADSMLELVSGLEAKSLLLHVQAPGSRVRFRQLESLRLYGLKRLAEAGELDQTYERLVTWLTTTAMSSARDGALPAWQAGRPLLAEQGNLRHAMSWAAEREDQREVPLAAALADCWWQCGHLSQGSTLLDSVLAKPGVPDEYRARALVTAAWLAFRQAAHDKALLLVTEAVDIHRRLPAPLALAKTLNLQGAVLQALGDPTRAGERMRHCLNLLRQLNRPVDTANCLHNMAWSAVQVGELDLADELMDECLPLLSGMAAPANLAAALHTAGALALAHGDLDAAEANFTECLRADPASANACYPLEGLAIVATARGVPRRALHLASAAAAARDVIAAEPEQWWQRRVDAAVTQSRGLLMSSEVRAATAAGARQGLDEAVSYALGQDASEPSVLTQREREVAVLVSRGLTNRQIAGNLGISERTVGTHVDNIRTKLDLRSRTQIAVWMAERSAGYEPHGK